MVEEQLRPQKTMRKAIKLCEKGSILRKIIKMTEFRVYFAIYSIYDKFD